MKDTGRGSGGPQVASPTSEASDDSHSVASEAIVGQSAALRAAVARVRRIAATEAVALIEGETGTGKELAARAIHYLGARRNSAFVCVNCGALPENLVENELFGHERGAYTGAGEAATGLIADADHGTLFLDEVEAMSPRTQVVLLRFLQDGVYRPIGSRRSVEADVRVIAASNTNLQQLVREGKFREDLLYRLRIMTVAMPPLRQRDGDIPILVRHFLQRLALQYRCPPKQVSADSMTALCDYHWPGNVRELENLLHRMFLFSDTSDLVVDHSDMRPLSSLRPPAPASARNFLLSFNAAKACAVKEFERSYVARALEDARGNISAAARNSGKERRAFGKLVKKYGLSKGRTVGDERLSSAAVGSVLSEPGFQSAQIRT
jgi:two-component system response regulator GlrR